VAKALKGEPAPATRTRRKPVAAVDPAADAPTSEARKSPRPTKTTTTTKATKTTKTTKTTETPKSADVAASPKAVKSSISRRRTAAKDRSGEAYTKRRQEILDAAAAVFRTKGYQSATLADVSEAVGVDRASLYFYVSSKEEIFDELVSGVVKANLAIAEDICAADDLAPVKLRQLVTQLMNSYAENYPFLYVYLQQNLAHVTEERQPWASELRAINRRYEAAVQSIIAQGVAEGSLAPLAEPRIVANGLMGMLGWTHRWFSPTRSPVDAAQIGETYAEMLLGGLVATKKSPVRPSLADAPARANRKRKLPTPHPDVVALAKRFSDNNVPTYDTVSVSHARALLEGVTRLQGEPEDVARVEDILIDGEGGQLPARLYHPAPGERRPIVVYFHGGGWTLGSVRSADRPCRALANSSGAAIVSVEYRRAPETKFPGPLRDAVSAVRWVAANAVELGGDGRLVLLGDSAGGNLAAATSLVLRDEGGPLPDAQVLIYPCLAPASTTDFDSYRDFADGPFMTRRELDWFWDHYLRSPDDALNPLAAPLHAPDLAGLPPTTVVVAELDPLCDEGVAFAQRLQAAGVISQLLTYRGAAHGFWWLGAAMVQARELTESLGPILRGNAR